MGVLADCQGNRSSKVNAQQLIEYMNSQWALGVPEDLLKEHMEQINHVGAETIQGDDWEPVSEETYCPLSQIPESMDVQSDPKEINGVLHVISYDSYTVSHFRFVRGAS